MIEPYKWLTQIENLQKLAAKPSGVRFIGSVFNQTRKAFESCSNIWKHVKVCLKLSRKTSHTKQECLLCT